MGPRARSRPPRRGAGRLRGLPRGRGRGPGARGVSQPDLGTPRCGQGRVRPGQRVSAQPEHPARAMISKQLTAGALGLQFLLELAVLGALGYWGFDATGGLPRRLLGLGAPGLALAFWAVLGAP